MSRHHDFTQAAAVLAGMDAAVDYVRRLCNEDRHGR
jgi:hypothetical protein